MAKNPRGDYDAVFKENLSLLRQTLVQYFFELQPEQQIPLPTELNRSAQRRVDWLQQVKTEQEEYILHLEIQAQNDLSMAERMLEYWLLLKRQYAQDIKQAVFYVGAAPLTMSAEIKTEQLNFRYRLINVRDIPAREFLNSEHPEEIILAILGDYENQAPESIARSILSKINSLNLETQRQEKYVRQLEIISKLRNLSSTIAQIITDMAIQFNLKDDLRYQQGLEQGERKKNRRLCHKLFKDGMELAAIAKLLDITEEEVKRFLAEKEEEQP